VLTIQPTGARGIPGTTGAGVAAGGFENDILKKTSSTDYATEWETPTYAATPNAIVRRDETGGAFFGGDVGAPKYRGNFYQAESATDGASLRNSSGTSILTWGATAANISITVDTTSTGHFFSNPGTATAGHFITKNGTAPTITAGRSAWFSNASGAPQFKNGTGGAVTLVYNSGALGTPSSGTLTNCTGLPISTGVSGLSANMADFLGNGNAANLQNALTGEYTGTGYVVMSTGPVIANINIETAATFNATSYNYGTGAAAAHRTALGLTALATTSPGTGVATLLTGASSGTAGPVGKTSPSVTNITTDRLTLSGNISAAAWTTSGLRIKGVAATLTDTSSSGTVAAAYTDAFGGNTIAASSAVTFTNYTTAFFREPTAGTNVTFTNKWALGAESARFGTSNQLTISTSGVLTATSPVFTTPELGTPSSGTVTNLTGTASININGTVGATTKNTGAFTTITATGAASIPITASTSGQEVARFVANNQYSGFRVCSVNTSNGTPYISLCTGATADASNYGTQKAFLAFWGDTGAYASVGYSASSHAVLWNTTSGGVTIGGSTTDAGATNLLVVGSTKSNAGFIYGTFTVGTFPSTTYLEAVVTDALTPVIGAAVTAGGSAKCKVMYNGSAKIVTAVL
jgi:hypothetical protein